MNYCPECGKPLKLRLQKCPVCKNFIPPSNYCEYCGHQLKTAIINNSENNIPLDRENNICIKYSIQDIFQDKTGKSIIIEHGTEGIIIEKGEVIKKLKPGKYEIKNIFDKIIKKEEEIEKIEPTAYLIVYDTGDINLIIKPEQEFSSLDNIHFNIELSIIIKIYNVEVFLKNYLKEKFVLPKANLSKSIFNSLYTILKNEFSKNKIEVIDNDLYFRTKLEETIGINLKTIFDNSGFLYLYLGYLNIFSNELEEWRERNYIVERHKNKLSERLKIETQKKEFEKELEIKNKEIELEKQNYIEKEINTKFLEVTKNKLEKENILEFFKLRKEQDKINYMLELYREKIINQYDLKKFIEEIKLDILERERIRNLMIEKNKILDEIELEKLKFVLQANRNEFFRNERIKNVEAEEKIKTFKHLKELEREYITAQEELKKIEIEKEIDEMELEKALVMKKKIKEAKKELDE